jgi:hypothetical protein
MICLSFYVYLTTSIIVLGYEAYKDRINTRWIFIDSLTALFIYYLCKNKLYYLKNNWVYFSCWVLIKKIND